MAIGGPALVAGVAMALTLVQAPSSNLYLETRLWLALGATGLVVSGIVALSFLVRGRIDQARTQAALDARRAAEEDHRRFLLRLDHELKNPVTAIQAGLANVAQVVGDGDGGGGRATAATPALESTLVQVGRLVGLVADLRKLAELESRTIERAPVDLPELLGEASEAIAELPGAEQRRVTLALPQAPWPLGTVPGDRDLLFLALHNLLVNAVKFTHAGDTIELRARDEGDRVIVEVADTGTGIPDAELGQVWDELARGSAARGTPGMGLGLALVRGVVSRHRGEVWIRSRPGHGTVVGLALPAG